MNNGRYQTLLLLTASLLLGGCASLNREDCLQMDFRQIGLQDGKKGLLPERLDYYAHSCSEFGVNIDKLAYREGYEEGLVSYCNTSNAIRLGSSGADYVPVCPVEKESEFFNHYMQGLKSFCSADYGFNSGKNGQLKNKNCQLGSFRSYDESYQRGYGLYLINSRKLAIKENLLSLDNDLKKLNPAAVDFHQQKTKLQREQTFLQQEYQALITREVALTYPEKYSAANE